MSNIGTNLFDTPEDAAIHLANARSKNIWKVDEDFLVRKSAFKNRIRDYM